MDNDYLLNIKKPGFIHVFLRVEECL